MAIKNDHARTISYHNLSDVKADRRKNLLPKKSYVCSSTLPHWDTYHDLNFQGTLRYI